MNVLIACTNRYQHPAPTVPYGACIVAEAAARAGHRLAFLDLMFQPDPVGALKASLQNFSPDVIGLSCRNLDNNDMQSPVEFVTDLAALVQTLRRLSPAPVVLGGPAVSVMPEPLLRRTGASFAILGDGETAFPALLKALENGAGLEGVPRLARLENGHYRVSPAPARDLVDSAILPPFRRWLDLEAYVSALATVPIQSKRGCPFSCIYCTYGISEGKDYRLFPPAEIAAAIHRLSSTGIKDIEFVDNVFNSPYAHALALCESLAARGHRARLQTLEMNPAFIDDRLLQAMARAGFVGVGVTAESAANPVLAGLRKGYTAADVESAAATIRRNSLPCFWLFLLGGPGETEQTVMETIRFARRTLRRGDVAFFTVGIRIYPGTELETIAREQGVLRHQAREMLAPVFYFAPELDLTWTLDQVRRAVAENLNMLHSASLSHPWLPYVNRLYRRLPLGLPLWKHTRGIRRVVRVLGRDI